MKVKELIEALKNCDQDSSVEINIRQCNKREGVTIPVDGKKHGNTYSWIHGNIYTTWITINLPDGAYIAKLPKDIKFI